MFTEIKFEIQMLSKYNIAPKVKPDSIWLAYSSKLNGEDPLFHEKEKFYHLI